jgi:hypothetical protein
VTKKHYSFFKFWIKSAKNGWSNLQEKFGTAIDFAALLAGIGLFLVAWYSKRHPAFNADKENAVMSYWFTIIPVGLWLLWLAYHILKAPYEIYKNQHEKYESEIAEKDVVIKKFESEVQAAKDSKPQLKLQSAFSERNSSGRFFCRIKVKNTSATGTANLVKVEVVFITPDIEMRFDNRHEANFVPYPIALRTSDLNGETIHPGCESRFDVFIVNRADLFGSGTFSPGYIFDVRFAGQPNPYQQRMDVPEFTLGKITPEFKDKNNHSLGFKEYSIKIRTAANGVPPIEKTFSLFFVADEKQDAVQLGL